MQLVYSIALANWAFAQNSKIKADKHGGEDKYKFYSKKVTLKDKLQISWCFLDMGCNIQYKCS